MSWHYPSFERRSPGGLHILSDGLVLNFFIQRPHSEIREYVVRALDIYRQTIGPESLGYYTGEEGYFQQLDAEAFKLIREDMLSAEGCVILLWQYDQGMSRYRFDYRGRMLGALKYRSQPDAVSGASFWLPTQFLTDSGPARLKELAVALGRELPFTSGYVSPAFNGMMDTRLVGPLIHEFCFRYPGIDIIDNAVTYALGARPKGAYWLNFYGQPLLNTLGGAQALREQLSLPGTSVEELQPGKVLVQLGEWPEVDGEMRAYRQLARVLKPHLYQEARPVLPPEEMRRWERRFLD